MNFITSITNEAYPFFSKLGDGIANLPGRMWSDFTNLQSITQSNPFTAATVVVGQFGLAALSRKIRHMLPKDAFYNRSLIGGISLLDTALITGLNTGIAFVANVASKLYVITALTIATLAIRILSHGLAKLVDFPNKLDRRHEKLINRVKDLEDAIEKLKLAKPQSQSPSRENRFDAEVAPACDAAAPASLQQTTERNDGSAAEEEAPVIQLVVSEELAPINEPAPTIAKTPSPVQAQKPVESKTTDVEAPSIAPFLNKSPTTPLQKEEAPTKAKTPSPVQSQQPIIEEKKSDEETITVVPASTSPIQFVEEQPKVSSPEVEVKEPTTTEVKKSPSPETKEPTLPLTPAASPEAKPATPPKAPSPIEVKQEPAPSAETQTVPETKPADVAA